MTIKCWAEHVGEHYMVNKYIVYECNGCGAVGIGSAPSGGKEVDINGWTGRMHGHWGQGEQFCPMCNGNASDTRITEQDIPSNLPLEYDMSIEANLG